MLGYIWFTMILLSIFTGVVNGTLETVIAQMAISAKKAFDLALSLGGIMTLWLGLMQVADDAGLIQQLGKLTTPLLHKIFPSVPKNHPAMGAISLNICANIFGLSNASTPFGIKAMEELESLNPTPETASDDMCMLLAINTSSVQLIPATAIGLLSVAGSQNPTIIIASTLVATTVSTLVAIFTAFKLARYYQ